MIVVQANHAPNSVIHCAGPRDRFTPIVKPTFATTERLLTNCRRPSCVVDGRSPEVLTEIGLPSRALQRRGRWLELEYLLLSNRTGIQETARPLISIRAFDEALHPIPRESIFGKDENWRLVHHGIQSTS
jgi:hypothetical protein